jgi:hypothetical protein
MMIMEETGECGEELTPLPQRSSLRAGFYTCAAAWAASTNKERNKELPCVYRNPVAVVEFEEPSPCEDRQSCP